jgi:osmotically-inducible protein OsmY
MPTVDQVILDNVRNEPSLEHSKVGAEITGGGILRRRKTVRLYGTVKDASAKKKIEQIAQHAVGDNYDIVDEIVVK